MKKNKEQRTMISGNFGRNSPRSYTEFHGGGFSKKSSSSSVPSVVKYSSIFITMLIALMMTGITLFTACDNSFTPENLYPALKDGYGRVSVKLVDKSTAQTAGRSARTVMPSMPAFDRVDYAFFKDGGEVTPTKQNEFFILTPGNYTVTVAAFIGDDEVASGHALFTLESGDSVSVNVPLSPLEVGNGKFTYSVTCPEGVSAVITLQKWQSPGAIDLNPVTAGNVTSQEPFDVEGGHYLLIVIASKPGFSGGVSEIIYIYPNMTTAYTKVFTDGDLIDNSLLEVEELYVAGAPYKKFYDTNAQSDDTTVTTLDLNGLVLTVRYNNGTYGVIENDDPDLSFTFQKYYWEPTDTFLDVGLVQGHFEPHEHDGPFTEPLILKYEFGGIGYFHEVTPAYKGVSASNGFMFLPLSPDRTLSSLQFGSYEDFGDVTRVLSPAKKFYRIGEEMDLTGTEIQAVFIGIGDATTTLPLEWFEIDPYWTTFDTSDPSKSGVQDIRFKLTDTRPESSHVGSAELNFSIKFNMYDVTFDLDGTITTQAVRGGIDVVSFPVAPTKTLTAGLYTGDISYSTDPIEFLGWFREGDLTPHNTYTPVVYDDTVFTARWASKGVDLTSTTGANLVLKGLNYANAHSSEQYTLFISGTYTISYSDYTYSFGKLIVRGLPSATIQRASTDSDTILSIRSGEFTLGSGVTLKVDRSGLSGQYSVLPIVEVSNSGTFYMTGGSITGNRTSERGGGVRVSTNSGHTAKFIKTGGSISGNVAGEHDYVNNKVPQATAGYGSQVYVDYGSVTRYRDSAADATVNINTVTGEGLSGTGTIPVPPTIPPPSHTPLTANTWQDDTMASADLYYSFSVTAGTKYYVWWNDSGEGSGKTGNIYLYGYYQDGTAIFSNVGSGWYAPQSFTPTTGGTVYLRATRSTSGTFSVMYSTSSTAHDPWASVSATPLTANTWYNDTMASSDIYYSFTVTAGTKYYVWWNDSYQSNGTKTADIYLYGYYQNGTAIFGQTDSGWSTPQSFTPTTSGTVYLKATRYSSGTFAVVYNTTGTRP